MHGRGLTENVASRGGKERGEGGRGKARHYILAYGSLMSTESRGKTGMLGRAWPVVVEGIRVGWSNVYPTATFLGAAPSAVDAAAAIDRSITDAQSIKGGGGGGEEKDEKKNEKLLRKQQHEGGRDRTFAIMLEIPADKNRQQIIGAFDEREGAKYVRSRVALNKISLWRPPPGIPYYEDDLPWGIINQEEEEKKEERVQLQLHDDNYNNNSSGGGDSKDNSHKCNRNDNRNKVLESDGGSSTHDDPPITHHDSKKMKGDKGGGGVITAEEEETDHHVWIYMMKSWQRRSSSSPVLQSYVDVVITGALEYHEEFCKEWISACCQWEGYVKHDRREPMYPRCLRTMPEELSSVLLFLLRRTYMSQCLCAVNSLDL